MVEERLEITEKEVLSILSFIDNGNNFLLSGGAGSGKTYSLVSVIRQVIRENPTSKVACMTYTNSAVKEIEERVNHKNLFVSTIHDFLWNCISNFQEELKRTLFDLAKDTESNIAVENFNYTEIEEKGIRYQENRKLSDGIISHDELLIIAEKMFSSHKKLSDIVQDKFKFIFIDEYQDTDEKVIQIFLLHFKKSSKKSIIGFFGDSMQSIYDKGIENLDLYKGDKGDQVREVQKKQNRRNPRLIFDLANKLRSDLTQEPSKDKSAPNMDSEGKVKEGRRLFLFGKEDVERDKIKDYLFSQEKWDFDNTKETKVLNLTHNLIADEVGFRNLMEIYDKDPIISLKKDIVEKIKLNRIVIDDNKTFDEIVDEMNLQAQSYLLDEIKLDENAINNYNKIKDLPKEDINDLLFTDNFLNELKDKVVKQTKIPKKRLHEFETIDDFVTELNFITKISKKTKIISNNVNSKLYDSIKDLKFSEVKKIYLDKDMLIDDKKQSQDSENKKGSKRDNLIKHLFKIQNVLYNYESKNYNEVIRVLKKNGKAIDSVKKKVELNGNIQQLLKDEGLTIEQVIQKANDLGIVSKDDDKLTKYIVEKEYIYNRVKEVSFQEFISLYKYLEGFTPFSTQHKTKGAEFNNVLVLLDNGKWNDYNFEYLFTDSVKSQSVLKRTQKIFYVCCTRAKENLAVYYSNPNENVLKKANEWFGEKNIKEIK
ncbi:UvrD-helicase domain-containing protein [Flavobacterium sp. LC2016-01]|uniref:UvrD-helicase domain-containing protein n=1 Tax=Flavobacterium sp. LC2016-01 TaxID=2675876 RepID=UPI0012BAAA91|nr:UvrD-helicase domain-containing protein [Flavobacterium sp. LC2016-01]MTH15543.1 AAA family ATPase [Flavobacterium sp. LC2016-01]